MNRREALRTTAVMIGGLMLTPEGLVLRERGVLTPEDEALVEAIADTLLPTTGSSPGARAAGVGATINLLLTDCYTPQEQVRVVNGLKTIRRAFETHLHRGFATLPANEREFFLRDLDRVAQATGPSHWFGLLRELAVRTYFTSEIGMTKARRWMLVPGRWVGCVPLAPGQPAWG